MNKEVPRWEQRFRNTAIFIGRIGLAYLFFTQLFWKLPPTYGCPADFAFTTANAEGRLARTHGLCDWVGIEQVWSERPRLFLTTNLDDEGPPEIYVNLSWLTRLNGLFIENVVQPNIRWFGTVIWLQEAFIVVTLLLGLVSRLGSLAALAISLQLALGLAGITSPYEWEWSYIQIVLLSLIMLAFAPGRIWGVDAWLRPRFQASATRGSWLGKVGLWLT